MRAMKIFNYQSPNNAVEFIDHATGEHSIELRVTLDKNNFLHSMTIKVFRNDIVALRDYLTKQIAAVDLNNGKPILDFNLAIKEVIAAYDADIISWKEKFHAAEDEISELRETGIETLQNALDDKEKGYTDEVKIDGVLLFYSVDSLLVNEFIELLVEKVGKVGIWKSIQQIEKL